MLSIVRIRTIVGLAAVAVFGLVLAHSTAALQCPAREPGACAKVHALMTATRARVTEPALAAAPMRAPNDAHGLLLAAAAPR